MIKRVDVAYKEALNLVSDIKDYIEDDSMRVVALNTDDTVDAVKTMGRVTFLVTSIISFLMLNKAFNNGEVGSDKLTEGADILLPELLKGTEKTSNSEEINDFVDRLSSLSEKVREIIIN